MTDHEFSHLQEWSEELRDTFGSWKTDGLYPMFRCTVTGAERVYGCVRWDLSKRELEDEFGPLDGELRARPTHAFDPNARREGAVEEAA